MTSIDIPATSGIYRIRCAITNKCYIGSAVDLHRRWIEHRKQLRRNAHYNPHLQRAWNKHGEEAFAFEILEFVLPIFLTAREQYWFNKLKPFGRKGFNIAPTAGSSFGREVSQTTRDKLSAVCQGKPSPNRGKKLSQSACDKMSARSARRGKPGTMLGKKHTPESHRKMKEADKNRPPVSAEAIERMRLAGLEYRMSEACRNNLAEANAKRMKTLIVTDPDGNEYTIHGMNQFCKEHNLTLPNLIQVAKGRTKQHKGWKARYPDENAS